MAAARRRHVDRRGLSRQGRDPRAVARSADRLYDGLAAEERATLRAVLLRLVTPSLDGDPVRCRVPARTCSATLRRDRVVGLLVRARLVTSEEASFEVAHEALARAWPRLRSWLDEDVAGQRILRHLTAAPTDGTHSAGPDTELYRGARLETALEWRDHTAPELTELERSFLDASEEHARSERRALEARAARTQRPSAVCAGCSSRSALLLVVAVLAGLVAVRQTGRAGRGARAGQLRALAATAMAAVDVDPERSALLALAALDGPVPTAAAARRDIEQGLHGALGALRVERRLADAGGTVDWSADGRHILTTGRATGDVQVRDVGTGDTVRTFPAPEGGTTDVVDSPDGDVIATAGRDGTLRLLDAATGEERRSVRGGGSFEHFVLQRRWEARGCGVAGRPRGCGTGGRGVDRSGRPGVRLAGSERCLLLTRRSEVAVLFPRPAPSSTLPPEARSPPSMRTSGPFDVSWSPDGRSSPSPARPAAHRFTTPTPGSG